MNTMIKKLVYKTLLVLIVITSSSCNKWLDVKPQDGLTKQDFWKTRQHLNGAVIGMYISLAENSVVSQLFKWGELRADMVALTPPPGKQSADDKNFSEGNILSNNGLVNWSNIYRVINNCNLIVDNAPLIAEFDHTVPMTEINSSIAEAKAVRALLYFYLLRVYRDVPLQLKGVSEDVHVESSKQSSPEEIFKQIEADLKFAEEFAVTTYLANPVFDKGRITKHAVNAIQADVYLWMEKYQEAYDACTKIVSSGKFALVPGDGSFFNDLYVEGNSQETIFALQYSTERPNPFYGMFIDNAKPFMVNTQVMMDLFPKDPTDLITQDLRADGVSYRESDGLIWKYNGANSTQVSSPSQSIANFTFYRYADVKLMMAEALNWMGTDPGKVLSLIDEVRGRAQALDASSEDPGDSQEALASYILNERAREFAFEGKRWFDILRYAKRNGYENKGVLVSYGTMNIPSALNASVTAKLQDINSHYLPVPFRELLANKNLVQNPFYK